MTTTPFSNTLNSFAEYLEYELQAELALQSSHLNLPERIHKEDFLKEYVEGMIFSKSMMKELRRRYGNVDQNYVASSVIVSNLKY